MNVLYSNLYSGLFIFLFCLSFSSVQAQKSAGGVPVGLQPDFRNVLSEQKIEQVNVPKLDMAEVRRQDEARGEARFAAAIDVDYAMGQQGTWTDLPNGDRLWRLKLNAQGAKGIFVMYDDFYMPVGGRMFMYDPAGNQIKGAYTRMNNTSTGRFLTGMIKGETAILEYYEPFTARGQAIIDIAKVYYAYETDFEPEVPEGTFRTFSGGGYGDALSCHININCDEGAEWQEHKRGVARMLRVYNIGMGWCSGSLINNTAQDEHPYFLSAFHCFAESATVDAFLDLWRFDFKYESASCADPASEPEAQSLLGCNFISGWEDSDFMLLELTETIPASYNVRFNGWNRTASHLPDTTTIIHHPQGDIQKVSRDFDDVSVYNNSINWNNNVITPPGHHYLSFMDEGTFENGSSGSSLFDEEGRITGQLHGGNASCSSVQAFFGRLSVSWADGPDSGSRLEEYLDPLGTGVLVLDELEPTVGDVITISGNVQARTGQNMANVSIEISSDSDTYMTSTDVDGNYSIELPQGPSYSVKAVKDEMPKNGVSTLDLILARRDILLIEQFEDPLQREAMDINNNGSLSTIDLIQIRRVILEIDDSFSPDASWRFRNIQTGITSDAVVDLIGLKLGDANGNANPN